LIGFKIADHAAVGAMVLMVIASDHVYCSARSLCSIT
jgi:hypothetical protein